jgi:hypothetical protein
MAFCVYMTQTDVEKKTKKRNKSKKIKIYKKHESEEVFTNYCNSIVACILH